MGAAIRRNRALDGTARFVARYNSTSPTRLRSLHFGAGAEALVADGIGVGGEDTAAVIGDAAWAHVSHCAVLQLRRRCSNHLFTGHEVRVFLTHVEQVRFVRPDGAVADAIGQNYGPKIIRHGVDDARPHAA